MLPRSPASVQIFSSAPPVRPYVDVAYLEAEQQSDMSLDGTSAFITKLRAHAAALGCDGVVLGAETNRPTVSTADVAFDVANALSRKPSEPPPDYGTPANLRGMLATCIVYLPEPGELEDLEAHRAASQQVATTAYDACNQRRLQILRQMQALPKASDRAKLIKQLPTCLKPE